LGGGERARDASSEPVSKNESVLFRFGACRPSPFSSVGVDTLGKAPNSLGPLLIQDPPLALAPLLIQDPPELAA
jgi:hypothetical protein